ncbi:MAG: SH3 beta-barrel fold-containing protein [Paludibacter sp.]|nr:SH3 beta-barrel fold-containing protein [Paludibacter sp.]
MKTINLSQIMSAAWRFFRISGQSFSECLKRAWSNFKLVQKMKTSIVKFYFQKVDGTMREAYGTLSDKFIPKTVQSENRKKNDTVQVYFDTEAQDWRCFKKLNLIY